ncbi:hypothetical protein C1H46_023523 [Malus baccata]|uniref:Uncharacterized protein n=1 Tax=Malus baccata TaxID=106549 RepID=A0A540LWN5_MALBA|nr:hypothetical protein C1H46_023523 [Malus baccata]
MCLNREINPTLSTLKARESQRTLKSKGASGPNKLVSATATSSKTEKVATSSLPENTKHEKHEATQGELPSGANCSQSASTIISRGEELPNIDDDCNQLEVSDYVDEIYQYYWVSEAQNPPPENFMSIQADITPNMRGVVVGEAFLKKLKFRLNEPTPYVFMLRFLKAAQSETKRLCRDGLLISQSCKNGKYEGHIRKLL